VWHADGATWGDGNLGDSATWAPSCISGNCDAVRDQISAGVQQYYSTTIDSIATRCDSTVLLPDARSFVPGALAFDGGIENTCVGGDSWQDLVALDGDGRCYGLTGGQTRGRGKPLLEEPPPHRSNNKSSTPDLSDSNPVCCTTSDDNSQDNARDDRLHPRDNIAAYDDLPTSLGADHAQWHTLISSGHSVDSDAHQALPSRGDDWWNPAPVEPVRHAARLGD
jgi:hypothetical protein